jgi:hypothetical protein
MDGELPEIFWYLFWIGFVILAFRMAYLGGKHGFDTKNRALDILKMYAEKGAEPPPAMLEQLTRQVFDDRPHAPRSQAGGGYLHSFIGFLFMACVSWGVHAWLTSTAAPVWQTAAAAAAWAFFGFGAFGFLLAAILVRPK